MARYTATLSGATLMLAVAALPAVAQTGSATTADRNAEEMQRRGPIVEGRRVPPRPEGRPVRRPARGADAPTGDPQLDAISRDLLRNDRGPPPRPGLDSSR
jgi:hypothetical protein